MRGLFFVAGLILGGATLLTAQTQGWLRVRRVSARDKAALLASAAEPKALSTDAAPAGRSVEEIRAALERDLRDPQGKSLDPLAILLEEAIFERSWPKVEAAAEAVRAHGAEWLAPAASPAPAGPEERTTADLQRDVEARIREHQLATRRHRATAIARGKEPRIPERLLDLLTTTTDEHERDDAALLLAKTGDERGVEGLVKLLSSPDADVRRAAGQALGREGYLAGLKEAATLARRSPDERIRETAVEALGAFRSVQSGESSAGAQAMIEALRRDDAASVRSRAAYTMLRCDLGRFRPYADALIEAVARDADAKVRGVAAGLLWNFITTEGDLPGVARAFELALPLEHDPEVAGRIVRALGEIGDAGTFVVLDSFAATGEGKALAQRIDNAREKLKLRFPSAR